MIGKARNPGSISAKIKRFVAIPAICMVVAYAEVHASAQQPAAGTAPRFNQPEPPNFQDHQGWKQIFDGKSLTNWEGPQEVWHAEDGAIVGTSSPEHQAGSTYIYWKGGEPANFRLKLEVKAEGDGANGGIQFRSHLAPPKPRVIAPERLATMTDAEKARAAQSAELMQKHAQWNITGYQGDLDFKNLYTSQIVEPQTPRQHIAWRGQAVATEPGKKATILASLGNSDELGTYMKSGEWMQYEIIADNHTIIQAINGHVMTILLDTDPAFAQAKGLIALQIEGPGLVKISYRNIWLQTLP